MANTRELRRRIRSVKNTSQITKAMQMVAATKMRRAQMQALSGRPYEVTLKDALSNLSGNVDPSINPLLLGKGKECGVLFLTTDKSLCGALNTNVFRAASAFLREKKDIYFYTVGKKGRNFVVKTGGKLEADFENLEVVNFKHARQIAKLLVADFLLGKLGEVYIIYPDFVSTLKQEPMIVKLLPVQSEELGARNEELGIKKQNPGSTNLIPNSKSEFLFEPNPYDLLDFVLNHQIETAVYQALLETKASEHSARMIAMQNATDNARELVKDLELNYNQTRQAGITNELLEITSAQAALE